MTVRAGGGAVETLRARAVISAVGQLNQPFVPDLPGAESFAGPSFHTARWDHSVPLEGKRVGVIGTGSTGVQVITATAPIAGHLTVFQRSPQYVVPIGNTPQSAEVIAEQFSPEILAQMTGMIPYITEEIKNDAPPPQPPMMGHNGGPPMDQAPAGVTDFPRQLRGRALAHAKVSK